MSIRDWSPEFYRRIMSRWVVEWRSLRAWGRPLEEVAVTTKTRKARLGSTGVASRFLRKATIRAGVHVPDALATILHEYAHLAAPDNADHGPAWRERFAAAIEEVTGVRISTEGNIADIDGQATDAVAGWWKRSGNQWLADMLASKEAAA